MTYDYHALVANIQEAERTMNLAFQELNRLKETVHNLEIENQRLRDRLGRAMRVIEHYEAPDGGHDRP